MSVAGIGGAGGYRGNRTYHAPSTVNVRDLLKSYKCRKPTASTAARPRRDSYTGFAMHCDTAINFDDAAHNNSIPTLSERVHNSDISSKSAHESKCIHVSTKRKYHHQYTCLYPVLSISVYPIIWVCNLI